MANLNNSVKRIKVLLVDDHTFVREAFRIMLELQNDIEVVGEAQNGRQAVGMVKNLQPEVVLMDIGMPLLNGLEATRQMLKAKPDTKVIILTAHSNDACVTNASEAGAAGFLLKETSAHEVHAGIRAVHQGKRFYRASTCKRFDRLSLPGRPGATSQKAAQLTSREVEILQLIAEGNANKQTASELNIALKTVEKHRENLMAKLDIHDTASLTRFAISAGIVESSVQFAIA